jgi:hypothetical protein
MNTLDQHAQVIVIFHFNKIVHINLDWVLKTEKHGFLFAK